MAYNFTKRNCVGGGGHLSSNAAHRKCGAHQVNHIEQPGQRDLGRTLHLNYPVLVWSFQHVPMVRAPRQAFLSFRSMALYGPWQEGPEHTATSISHATCQYLSIGLTTFSYVPTVCGQANAMVPCITAAELPEICLSLVPKVSSFKHDSTVASQIGGHPAWHQSTSALA